MAQKYYNSEETAKTLGVSTDEVKKMIDRRELHGYRDGADWKFKVEDIDRLAEQRQAEKAEPPAEERGGDVLLSEVELGQSGLGTSGTVIAMDGAAHDAAKSDILLASSDINISRGGESFTPTPKPLGEVDSKTSKFEELELTLDEDLTLEDSTGKLPGGKSAPADTGTSGSAIDLTGKDLEDDDLVLGGSSKGSDVTIGGDSGISLLDPADSGLSLEQPLNLGGGAGDSSLELGEEDLLASGAGGGSPTQLRTDSDFLLTPLDEAADVEGSESGSQVIALDTEIEPAGMAGSGAMAAMLDEDLSAQPALDMGMGEPLAGGPFLGAQSSGISEGVPLMQPGAVLPEAPYSGLQIAGLATSAVILMFCGMMTYDLLRNMWSWQGPYAVNSSLMDMLAGLFGGR